MSMYKNQFSNFPEQSIVLHEFLNIDNSETISSLMSEINDLRISGKYDEAQSLINQNTNVLSKYIIDALVFNLWEEEIYNAQLYTTEVQQNVYFGSDIPDCILGDLWLTGGENIVD